MVLLQYNPLPETLHLEQFLARLFEEYESYCSRPGVGVGVGVSVRVRVCVGYAPF
jgi:hypothetical protein